MQNPRPLKPKQLLALEILVAGGTDLQAARAVGCGRSSIYRWKRDELFAGELQHRTLDATETARRMLGADIRGSIEVSMLATKKFRDILTNPNMPPWMQLQAAQSAKKNGRFAADKLDPDFRSLEAVGRNDRHRQNIADEVTRRIAVWENRDLLLERLQNYEQRRSDERNSQRETELLRRLNIACRHNPLQRAYLYSVWRREDDHQEELESLRREQARKEFAAAAGVDPKDLPPAQPVKWADIAEQFEDFIQSAGHPQNEEEELAEHKRMQELEYLDPNSPEGQAHQEKFEAEFKKVEADYKANVLPKATPSPIDRGVGSAGVPRPPLKEEAAADDERGGRETPALPTRKSA
jgi:hypothetical protein